VLILAVDKLVLVGAGRLNLNMRAVDAREDVREASFLIKFSFLLVSLCLRWHLYPLRHSVDKCIGH